MNKDNTNKSDTFFITSFIVGWVIGCILGQVIYWLWIEPYLNF